MPLKMMKNAKPGALQIEQPLPKHVWHLPKKVCCHLCAPRSVEMHQCASISNLKMHQCASFKFKKCFNFKFKENLWHFFTYVYPPLYSCKCGKLTLPKVRINKNHIQVIERKKTYGNLLADSIFLNVHSSDLGCQICATFHCCKILLAETHSAIQIVIASKVVPQFVEFLGIADTTLYVNKWANC
jgi:hypothetical protein